MKKLCTIMIVFSFLLAGCDKDMESLEIENEIAVLKKAGTNFELPNTFDAEGNLCLLALQTDQDKGTLMELWMGVGNEKAGTLIGHVKFESDKVLIDLTDADNDGVPDMYPYVIEEVHIHFADDVSGIPQTKKGNPIPGLFEYKTTFDNYETLIEIPVKFYAVGAIHLTVTKFGGIEGFEFYLPEEPVQVKYTYTGPQSYLQMVISGDNAGALIGTYDSWCVNTQITLNPALEFDALLYSSYEEIPAGIVDKPGNFDLINYLINHYTEGTVVELKNNDCSPVLVDVNPVLEPLTWMDIQRAIWHIIDDEQSVYLPSGWKQERVNAIICDVEANGMGFVPTCDQKIVFLVVPVKDDAVNKELFDFSLIVGQPNISSVPVPCEDEGGTAWGDGYYGATFLGKQWGTWFIYDATCGQ